MDKEDKESISLKDFLADKLIANDEKVKLAFEASKIRLDGIDRLTEVAKASMDKRLEGMNEDIRSLRESRAEISGKADQSTVNVSMMLSMLSLFLAILGVVIVWIKK